MVIEIERRFLVKGEEWKSFVKSKKELAQGYLTTVPNSWTVRIRIQNHEKAWITLKMPFKDISNYEFEYQIPSNDGELLLDLSENKLRKTRYEVNWENNLWSIDCFKEENNSLVIAEIELNSKKEALNKPIWCGEEITGLYKWSNASLAKLPISEWSIKNRLEENS